jgi:hypothetical protein
VNNDLVRYGLAAAVLWYVFAGPAAGPVVPASGPYTGTMSALHTAAASMDGKDRKSLADAVSTAGEILKADTRGLLDTTEEAQRYVAAVLEFSYNGLGQPKQRYPAVADAISAEAKKIVGETSGTFDAAGRAKLSDALAEMGRALK